MHKATKIKQKISLKQSNQQYNGNFDCLALEWIKSISECVQRVDKSDP